MRKIAIDDFRDDYHRDNNINTNNNNVVITFCVIL